MTAMNAVEIAEAVAYLRNEQRERRLDEVTLALCAEMLVVAGIADDRESARQACDRAVTSGRAAEVFAGMVTALGGPEDFVDDYRRHLPAAPVVRPVHADGFLTAMDTRLVGNTIIELGGGRRRLGDTLDLSVGFTDIAAVGTRLDADTPLALVHAASEADADRAAGLLRSACALSEQAPETRPVVTDILSGRP